MPEFADDVRAGLFALAAREIGEPVTGVLLGDEAQVTAFVPAPDGPEPFSDAGWAALEEQVDLIPGDPEVVGWFRSKPGAVIGIAAEDVEVLEARFAGHPAVLLVLHPVGERARLAWWDGASLVATVERRGLGAWEPVPAG